MYQPHLSGRSVAEQPQLSGLSDRPRVNAALVGGSHHKPHCTFPRPLPGPDVEIYSCKTPGDNDDNQRWRWDAANRRVQSLDGQTANGWTCLSASAGPSGSSWATGVSPAGGPQWCLEKRSDDEGGTTVGPCDSGNRNQKFTANPSGGANTYQLGFGYNNGFAASGPWPHTRYITGGGPTWVANLSSAAAPGGWTTIRASDTTGIIDDNSVGLVTQGGAFCLDVRRCDWHAGGGGGGARRADWARDAGKVGVARCDQTIFGVRAMGLRL